MDDDDILLLVIKDAIADDSSAGYPERAFKLKDLTIRQSLLRTARL
jgi:hypothetical protein